jgi:hypothetical protein
MCFFIGFGFVNNFFKNFSPRFFLLANFVLLSLTSSKVHLIDHFLCQFTFVFVKRFIIRTVLYFLVKIVLHIQGSSPVGEADCHILVRIVWIVQVEALTTLWVRRPCQVVECTIFLLGDVAKFHFIVFGQLGGLLCDSVVDQLRVVSKVAVLLDQLLALFCVSVVRLHLSVFLEWILGLSFVLLCSIFVLGLEDEFFASFALQPVWFRSVCHLN